MIQQIRMLAFSKVRGRFCSRLFYRLLQKGRQIVFSRLVTILTLLIFFTTIINFSVYSIKKSTSAVDLTKQKLENIRLVLKFGTTKQVAKVLNGFKLLKEKEQNMFLKQLVALLESPNVIITRKVLEVIGQIKSKSLDKKLLPYLESSSNELFFTAIHSVDKKEVKMAIPVITKLIKEIDFTKSNNRILDIFEVLNSLKDITLGNFLFDKLVLENTNLENRRRIMLHLANIDYKGMPMVDFLTELIKNEKSDQKLRETAVYSLGKMKIVSTAPLLRDEFEKIEKLTDVDEKRRLRRIRRNIIYSLVQFKDKSAKKILFMMARDDDESIRLKMIDYIKEINSPELRELLEYQSKYDINPKVQKAAKKALGIKE